jgi:hypothetical protein
MRLAFAAVLLAASMVAATVIPSQQNEAPALDLSKRQCGCDCVSPKFCRRSSVHTLFPMCRHVLISGVVPRTTNHAEAIAGAPATPLIAAFVTSAAFSDDTLQPSLDQGFSARFDGRGVGRFL